MNISIERFLAGVTMAMLCASSSHAGTILIDFDQLKARVLVNDFYNGGNDSSGASGPNLGVGFVHFETTRFIGATSPPNIAYNTSRTALINDAAGFKAVSFTYGFFVPGTVNVYAGLNGSGALLGHVLLARNNPSAGFAPGSVPFSGTGESITVVGGSGQLGIDNLRLTTTPLPASWTMMLAGLAGCGFAAYRGTRKNIAIAAI